MPKAIRTTGWWIIAIGVVVVVVNHPNDSAAAVRQMWTIAAGAVRGLTAFFTALVR